jgi:CheY-like chemotaxis protein
LIRQTKYYRGKELDGKDLSIILMDLEMPVMDGLTCVRKIREMEVEGLVMKRLPIIAVTANARGEQIAAARDSGMVSLLHSIFVFMNTNALPGRCNAQALPDTAAGSEDRGVVTGTR